MVVGVFYVFDPTQRHRERRQRPPRRRLSTRTPRHHMSNMMNQIAKNFATLKIIVWTPDFAKTFDYVLDHRQSFRGALPRVLHLAAARNHMNDSLL